MIAQGAEAHIFKIGENTLKKVRLPKPYRLIEIDEKLRKFRNKREFKVLSKLYEADINVPEPFEINSKDELSFTFEYINGTVLKEVLNNELLEKAFENIILMHNENIVHGDLTTLNMIEKDGEIYLIDFGLAEFSHKVEDKAVDLNLFFTCIKNEHPDFYEMKERLEKEYETRAERGNSIIERLHKIEHRGRNK